MLATDGVLDSGSFVPGTSFLGLAVAAQSAWAAAPWSMAYGNSASAFGGQSIASGDNSFAAGNTAYATGDTAMAVGAYSVANGNYSTTLGYGSYTNATQATAVGTTTNAYAPGMTAVAGGQINNPGDSQSTATIFGGETTDATPTGLSLPLNQAWIFEDWNGFEHTDWSKTLLVKATCVARREDVPGTDSVWTAQGVLRGDGESTYTWIGGTAPAFTVVAQDAAAAAWAVAIAASDSPGITVTVTGADGETIDWCCEVATVEVSGSTA